MEALFPYIPFIFQKALDRQVYLKQSGDPGRDLRADIEEREKDEDDKKFFLCKICRNSITPYETKIVIDGHHRHTFVNPAGIEYSIGCFSSAEGCFEMGTPTKEFTWFPGYSWSYAICSKCRSHLGWSYRASGSRFYGLILDNLIVS